MLVSLLFTMYICGQTLGSSNLEYLTSTVITQAQVICLICTSEFPRAAGLRDEGVQSGVPREKLGGLGHKVEAGPFVQGVDMVSDYRSDLLCEAQSACVAC